MLEFSTCQARRSRHFPTRGPSATTRSRSTVPSSRRSVPKTGLPDFGEIRITYVPDARCVELKSLKYYLIEFRNRGIFYEHVDQPDPRRSGRGCSQPRRMTVVGDFSVRGGIKTAVTATYVEAVMRMRRGPMHRIPHRGELDLHAFAPRDIPSVVERIHRRGGRGGLARGAAGSRPRPRRAARDRPGDARAASARASSSGTTRRRISARPSRGSRPS